MKRPTIFLFIASCPAVWLNDKCLIWDESNSLEEGCGEPSGVRVWDGGDQGPGFLCQVVRIPFVPVRLVEIQEKEFLRRWSVSALFFQVSSTEKTWTFFLSWVRMMLVFRRLGLNFGFFFCCLFLWGFFLLMSECSSERGSRNCLCFGRPVGV